MNAALANLNPRQREAVYYDGGGALVLAGAGTGKTKVLTGRIIRLLSEQQATARQILAVTFTNKAAREMRLRIENALTSRPDGLMLGTFHSVCHRILRIHAASAGLDKNFQILDSQEQTAFLRRLLREAKINETAYPVKDVRQYINAQKERGRRAADVDINRPQEKEYAELYALYERACRRESKLDFTELLLATLDLLRERTELREHYATRFRHILIDEWQDTNQMQLDWLTLLDSGDNHFFAVGDDDQSIYAFRGAEPEVMPLFQSRFRAGRLIRLEENYRSTKTILDAANRLIAHNHSRLGKTLVSTGDAGNALMVHFSDTDEAEASDVAAAIKRRLENGAAAQEIAVLYRTNAQGRLFERALSGRGIPYRVYGGLRFYDRQEVKHALAYLRLAAEDDVDSLLRVINMPPRGIGEKTIADLQQDGDIFKSVRASFKPHVLAFRSLLGDLHNAKEAAPLGQLMQMAVEISGLLDYFTRRNETERSENLRELVNAATQFEQHFDADNEEGISALAGFLATVALESSGDEATNSNQPAVGLMTVHAAKGLEFNTVFIVGLEEGLFPHEQSLSGAESALEEERRLMYVALTRARKELSLHLARQRMLYGNLKIHSRSRFVDELPPDLLAVTGNIPSVAKALHMPADSLPPPPRVRLSDGGFRAGDSVSHPRYGGGVVLRRSGGGADAQVEVMFKKAGKKSFKIALAPLEKI